MRHGETENNKNGIIQGSEVDSDINEIGDIQALKFYNSYKKICFDKVYVSALKRTYQTVKRFIDDGIPYESLKEFTSTAFVGWPGTDSNDMTPSELKNKIQISNKSKNKYNSKRIKNKSKQEKTYKF